jgi:hypothetical protein
MQVRCPSSISWPLYLGTLQQKRNGRGTINFLTEKWVTSLFLSHWSEPVTWPELIAGVTRTCVGKHLEYQSLLNSVLLWSLIGLVYQSSWQMVIMAFSFCRAGWLRSWLCHLFCHCGQCLSFFISKRGSLIELLTVWNYVYRKKEKLMVASFI